MPHVRGLYLVSASSIAMESLTSLSVAILNLKKPPEQPWPVVEYTDHAEWLYTATSMCWQGGGALRFCFPRTE